MKYQKPKGTADILPPYSKKANCEQKARETFALYNYEEIRTPMFEKFEVFSRSAGVLRTLSLKMYDFDDRAAGMCLAPRRYRWVIRAFVENKLYGLNKNQ